MKLYCGDIGIEMPMEEFLLMLEEDGIEEAVSLIMGLNEMYEWDEDDFEEMMGDLPKITQVTAEEFEKMFGIDPSTIEQHAAHKGDFLPLDDSAGIVQSEEDKKLERVVKRYSHIANGIY